MARPEPRPILLRETPHAAPAGAPVIDARFKVIGRKGGAFRRVRKALLALVIAATIGFLIPPLWMLAQALLAD